MDTRMIQQNLNDEDYLIRVRPSYDEDGVWTGEIDLSVITSPGNPLCDEDYWQMIHFCKMMCASVPVMEENEQIRNIVSDYVDNTFDNEYEVSVQLEDDVKPTTSTEGNVITLDFGTKTEGNS